MALDRRTRVGGTALLAVAAIGVAATSCAGAGHPASHTPLPAERLGEPRKPPHPKTQRFLREVNEAAEGGRRQGSEWGPEVQRALEGAPGD